MPEIWIEFSKRTGSAEFSRTTRDEPDDDKLMRYRLDLLDRHGLKLPDIRQVIDGMGLLPASLAIAWLLEASAQRGTAPSRRTAATASRA